MQITRSQIRRIIKEEISALKEGEITGKREAYEVEPTGYEIGIQSDDEVITDDEDAEGMDAAQVQAMHSDEEDQSTENDIEPVVDLPESWERIAFGPRRW